MRCLTFFLQNGILAFTLAIGIPVSVPAVEPNRELPPPVSYAPTDQYPLDDARCKTKLERELPKRELPSATWLEEYYHCKIDFARLEHDYPLTRGDLKKITPKNIKVADQEQIDQIYARLTAGPIPDGPFEIQLFQLIDFGPVVRIAQQFDREQLEQFKGLASLLSKSEEERKELMQQVWHGKVFDKNQRIARTRLGVFPAILVFIESLLHGDVGGFSEARLRFPAKVYCGQSLLDGRRESIIIDYGFSDELTPYYREYLDDWLLGHKGLQVRDEIRMVRPGFYLGRAYAGRIFVLNFILYNKAIAEQDTAPAEEDCWIGSQRLAEAREAHSGPLNQTSDQGTPR